jgi:hypothetical protein
MRANALQSLLDAPVFELVLSGDGKRVYALQPFEVSVLHAKTLELIRSIEVPNEVPSVAETEDGELLIGGHHLYRVAPLAGRAQKAGARLGGWVDRVAMLRGDQLIGVGQSGEILWTLGKSAFDHQRAQTHTKIAGPLVLPNQHAVFADGGSSAWILDPAHPEGYTQLHLKRTSVTSEPGERIVALHTDPRGRIALAAADGAVAITTDRLTISREFCPRAPVMSAAISPWERAALAIANDERWLYVLRPGGEIHRFLLQQPARPKESPAARPGAARVAPADPLPPAQYAKLDASAEFFILLGSDEGENYQCPALVAGRRGTDLELGYVSRLDLETLSWQGLTLRERPIVEVAPPPAPPAAPSFVVLRNKPKGPALKTLAVDDVLAADGPTWICAHQGPLLERATQVLAADIEILPGDTLVMAAMLKPANGLIRPALALWPAHPEDASQAEEPTLLVWGDAPRGWFALNTLTLREQRWPRAEFFPCAVMLREVVRDPPGKRRPLPAHWQVNGEAFSNAAQECKRLLKVLW